MNSNAASKNPVKHIIFGGFDYAVLYEMNHDAIFQGIDYFVDNSPSLIGTTYIGKEIRHPDALLSENKDDILILIGSIVYRTELSFQLRDMGFEEGKHFLWAIDFCGDSKCPRLWKHIEWNDRENNAASLEAAEKSEQVLSCLKVVARMIDFDKFDTLIDVGAANERIRPFLPQGIRYIPVDYIRYSDDTVLCDINKDEFPNSKKLEYDPQKTCIISIGHIPYCRKWRLYLNDISKNCTCFILGKRDFARINREFRRTHWSYYNTAFNHEYVLYTIKLGFSLTDVVDFRLTNEIYKFEKLN